jgi:hypothetical protein
MVALKMPHSSQRYVDVDNFDIVAVVILSLLINLGDSA